MPQYKAITSAGQLPKVGDGFETAVLDFKVSQDPAKRFEPAKDVTAFANHLGGTLVIGAAHAGGVIQSYTPVPANVAEKIETCFSEAVQQRCRPEPIFHADRIPHGTGYLVAINIEPSIPLVSVLAKEGDAGFQGIDNSKHGAWLVPVRVGTGTGFISPERLPMYMVASIRRTVLILRSIQRRERVHVHFRIDEVPPKITHGWFHFDSVDENRNVAIFRPENDATQTQSVPLDMIKTVYKDGSNWNVTLLRYEATR